MVYPEIKNIIEVLYKKSSVILNPAYESLDKLEKVIAQLEFSTQLKRKITMNYYLYNAIRTPDGTILWCQTGGDYKTHTDTVSGEEYMNDGIGYSIRRSVNTVPYQDISVNTSSPFEIVRTVKFWASYGKDGNSPKHYMSLEEMEKTHIEAILKSQSQIKGTEIEKVFLKEIEYRVEVFQEHLDTTIATKTIDKKKMKI